MESPSTSVLSPYAKSFIPIRRISPLILTPKEKPPIVDDPVATIQKLRSLQPRTVIFVDMHQRLAVARRTEKKALEDNTSGEYRTLIIRIRDGPCDEPLDKRVINVIVNPTRIELWISIVLTHLCTHMETRYPIFHVAICACHADRSILRASIQFARPETVILEYDYELDATVSLPKLRVLPPAPDGVSRAQKILNSPRNVHMRSELIWLFSIVIPARADIDEFIDARLPTRQ